MKKNRKAKLVRVTVGFPANLKQQIQEIADAQHLDFADVVRQAVAKLIDQRKAA